MATNEDTVRRARIYATDISRGDVIVDITGEYVGTVESVPVVDYRAGKVSFEMFDGQNTVVKTYRVTTVVRIEIARSAS